MSILEPSDTEAYWNYLGRMEQMDLRPDALVLLSQVRTIIMNLNETLALECDNLPECEL